MPNSSSPLNTVPATKPHTIHDVARVLGVSKTTVSKAFTGNGRISPATRDAVLLTAREMGFDVNPHAQRLSRGRSQDLVGLFSPENHTGANETKTREIQRLLDAHGLEVPLYTSAPVGGDEGKGQVEALRRLCRLRPRAIVCFLLRVTPETLDELRAYQASGGLLVCYDHDVPIPCDQVVFDRVDNTYQTTRHLLELGHTKIGLYVVGSPVINASYAAPRVEGFQKALAEYGLTPRAEWLWSNGLGSEDGGAQLAQEFLALPARERPTAMCIINEGAATGFMHQLLRAGLRIPQDVSVVSHDNLPIAEYAIVPLTSISHPVREIASTVTDLLVSRLEDPSLPPRRVVLRGQLFVRESTAAPGAQES